MRRLAPLLMLVPVACATLLNFTVEQTASTDVQGSALGGLLAVVDLGELSSLDVAVAQELENQGVAPGDVSEVLVVSLELDGRDGAAIDFIDTLDVTIEADGLDPLRIAWVDEVPDGATHVALTVTDADLADYVSAPSMTIVTDASGTAPADDVTLDATIVLSVTATPQGACNALSAG